jgi:hypothetical protein
VNITQPSWFWRPFTRIVKPLSRFSVILPLAALCLVGTLLLQQDSQSHTIIGEILCIPFALWTAICGSFFLIITFTASFKILTGQCDSGTITKCEHSSDRNKS